MTTKQIEELKAAMAALEAQRETLGNSAETVSTGLAAGEQLDFEQVIQDLI